MQSRLQPNRSLVGRGLRSLGRALLRTLVCAGLLISLAQGVQVLQVLTRQTQGLIDMVSHGRDLCNCAAHTAQRAGILPVGQLRRLVCPVARPHLTS